MAAKKQGTSLWVTLGCGCCLLGLVALGAVVAAGYLGVSAVKDYVEDLKDPASRSAKAAAILGTAQLPDGYSAQLYLRIPWVFDMVVLADGEPAVFDEEDDFDFDPDHIGDHSLVFFTLRQGNMDEEEIDDMLRGRRTSDNVKVDVGFEVDPEEELARGSFEIEPQRLSYVAYRGELVFDNKALPGIYSRILIDCPGDSLTRAAIWFRRQAQDIEGAEALGVAGSPADEAALREFMGHFNVCVD